MAVRNLRTRFILAGGLLAAVMAICGTWSVGTFAHLSSVVDETLQSSQEKIDLTALLASTLEREDDALLLALSGDAGQARVELDRERNRFEDAFARLLTAITEEDERSAATSLRRHVDDYRRAGDGMLRETAVQVKAREIYHESVNPALRKAVADCERLREQSFHAMRRGGIDVRNQAQRASGIVAGISLVALACSALVAMRLARSILGPIRELTRGVEAIRDDDLAHRVRVDRTDELGRLAEGYNRMAERLSDYRNSSLGEVLLAKATLESTLAVLPDAVIVVDPDGRVVARNALAQAVLQAKGGADVDHIHELPLPAEVLRSVDEILRGERAAVRPDLSQALTVSANGRSLRMLASVTPIPEFLPRRRGAVLVLADVTDFARLDGLRSELVAVASHELKTPLTSLRMSLLLLREGSGDLTARQGEILAAGVGAAEELAGTIDELLDLTRIEAGQLRLQRDRVDLGALIEQATGALRPRFEDAAIRLNVIHDDAPRAVVRGDGARLRIVFANLLDNALKYTPAGGEVVVHLSSPQNAAANDQHLLQIAVTDTGPGVPAEHRQRVFEKFFRVEHHRGEEAEGVRGAGIGLYLCRQIIEAHGGSIRCEPGGGECGTQIIIQLEIDSSEIASVAGPLSLSDASAE
jgi:NtrC-family two-component system sensor histidine kinase KinB